MAGEAASNNLRGPSAAEVAAAGAMKPSEQRQMAEGMVAQLEARLQSEPKNVDGWVMLMRSRMTLGEPAKAAATLQKGLAAFRNDGASARKLREAEAIGSIGWEGNRGRSVMWISREFLLEYHTTQAYKLAIIDAACEKIGLR